MKNKSGSKFSVFMTIFMLTFTVQADESASRAQNAQALYKLQEQMHQVQLGLNKARGERDNAGKQLDELDKKLTDLYAQRNKLEREKQQNEKELAQLKLIAANQKQLSAAQLQLLIKQLRVAYALGQKPYMKLILEQKDPATVNRVLAYYRYFNEARLGEIDIIGKNLAKINQTQSKLQQANQKLAELSGRKKEAESALQTMRKQRLAALKKINHQLSRQDKQLTDMRADELRLQQLIGAVNQHVPSQSYVNVGNFGDYRGQLSLPVNSPVLAGFGAPRRLGDMKWRGLLLGGRPGQPVKAVFSGKVVFADWLRGFGLVLILDHGNGYMTLYGYNQNLYHDVGDSVQAGELIADLGIADETGKPGIYFEIRHNGRPLDPLSWCKR